MENMEERRESGYCIPRSLNPKPELLTLQAGVSGKTEALLIDCYHLMMSVFDS